MGLHSATYLEWCQSGVREEVARTDASKTAVRATAMKKTVSPSARDKVRELKRDFVVQVYCGRGLFWKGVARARIVQGVEATIGVPSARPLRPRLSLSYPKGHPKRPKDDPKELRAWVKRKRWSWDTSVRAAWEWVVPKMYWEATNWDEFTATCILYEPPEPTPDDPDVLEEFAGYGSEGSRTEAPPIEWIDSTGHRVDAMEELYQGLLEELDKRHFKLYGASIWEAVSDIYIKTDLWKKFEARMREIETQPYIVVGKNTTDADIVSAARVIRSTQKKNSGGRPPLDKLTAIKAATLYHDHNSTDSDDRRRRKRWSLQRLGREFGPDKIYKAPERVGQGLVKLGESLRQERKKNKFTT